MSRERRRRWQRLEEQALAPQHDVDPWVLRVVDEASFEDLRRDVAVRIRMREDLDDGLQPATYRGIDTVEIVRAIFAEGERHGQSHVLSAWLRARPGA